MGNNVTYILVLICLLFIILYLYLKRPLKEGLGEGPMAGLTNIVNDMNDFMKFLNTLPDRIDKKFKAIGGMFKAIPDSFDVLNNEMKSSWRDLTSAIPDGFNEFVKNFNEGRAEFNLGSAHMNRTMTNAYNGTIDGITEIGGHLQLVLDYIEEFSVFVGKYIWCGLSKIVSLPYCLFFYLLEVVGYMFYLPILFAIYLIEITLCIDLQPRLKQLWDILYCMDDIFYSMSGYYLLRYSPAVIKLCYQCDLAPLPDFPAEIFVADYEKMVKSLAPFNDEMKNAMDNEVIPAFGKMINSGNSSVNVTNQKFARGFQGMKNAFTDSNKKYKDDLERSFHDLIS